MKAVKLKVAEAIQDDVNKGIVRIDSTFMHELDVRPEDVVEIKGERTTLGIIDRAYPGDIGLNIIRMDGLVRRNARAGINEFVEISKADIKEAKSIIISPIHKDVRIEASPKLFKRGLIGRAVLEGDIVSLAGSRRRKNMQGVPFFDSIGEFDSLLGFGLSDLKFIIANCDPKQAVQITDNTEITYNPEPKELKVEKALEVTYEDIGGLQDEVTKVREMMELPLKHPEIFERLGIEPPKGVLLHGPPGTGKTLLAKAVANETQANFISISGPEIISKYYGQSEQNLRKKFEEAEKNAPSIIFIDEIDAIAIKREESHGEVERRVVAQLLLLMDGLKSRGKVVVMAASNIPNALDPALRRPGRFDREIEIAVPDTKGRENILRIHTRNMPLDAPMYSDAILTNLAKQIEKLQIVLPNKIQSSKEIMIELEEEIKQGRIVREDAQLRIQDAKLKITELEQKKTGADQATAYKIAEAQHAYETKIEDISRDVSTVHEQVTKKEEEILHKQKELESYELQHNNVKLMQEQISNDSFARQVAEHMKDLEESKWKCDVNDSHYTSLDPQIQKFISLLLGTNMYPEIIHDSKIEGKNILLHELAGNTYGFVGADLYALSKEAAMSVLRRVLPDIKNKDSIPMEELEKLVITQHDFKEALKVVQPSAMREVFVEIPNVTWNDVGGLADIRQELLEAVEWPLKHPEVYTNMGIRPPKGILIYGPPGTGKTLLAKAVANESKANFISVKGSELLSKWVNETPQLVKKLFSKARQVSPCIVFIDEVDAIAANRNVEDNAGKGMNAINQLLTEMDGLESLNDVIVIAATNRPDIIDSALMRPGRFDRIILASVPNNSARIDIFKIHTKTMPFANDVDLEELATITEGFVGADIELVCREAAILALREDIEAKIVKKRHFEASLEKVKPSVSKEVTEVYENFREKFRQVKTPQLKKEQNYFG